MSDESRDEDSIGIEPRLLRGIRISFSQVRSFVTLASTCNFTRAASALNLTQPALTSRIRQLETALELRLFERDSRSVLLTEVGRELLPSFLRLVNDLESAVVSAKEHAAKADNTIRVACVPSCLSALLPQAIRKFKDQRADTGFAIEDVVHDRVLNLVHQGTVDIGICAAEKVDIDLLSEHLIDDPLVVVYPPDHPLTKRRSIHIADLARYPLVLTNRNGSVIDRVERAFAANGLIFAPAYEVNYGNAIIALVQAGLGVGIAPKLTAEIYGTALSIRTVDEPAFARSLFIISRRNVPLRKAVGAFVDVLKSAAKERIALSPAIDLHDRTAKTT